MPKRTDIQRVLIIGSGPIVIGQACEFDYSGTQACKALRAEGIGVVLVNSNPATIMTDPEFSDRTYIEPVTPEAIEKILAKETSRGTPIDAVLPTLGGQTGLNCAMACHARGIFAAYGVRMLAASPESIHKAEDRQAFREAMIRIGLDVPRSGIAKTWEEARRVGEEIGLPVAIRPAFTLGGTGGGFARTAAEFEEVARRGLSYSPVSQILIEESLYGWKEFELEVMRDRNDNVVIICSIENFDPTGVHTGDSIIVAPAQTLSDREYQKMRNASIKIIREIGVETGGSNIQFAVHPQTGRQCVIEMNPRVSRSSALASKATGFPIAKIATLLAIGYTLDEIRNDITGTTPACFEPALDYVVVKIPRWTFEKFPEADETLTTQMKSVGEAMAIGRTFKEAFQKCIRSMEVKRFGFGLDKNDRWLDFQKAHLKPRSTDSLDFRPKIGGGREGEAPADTREERAAEWPIPASVLEEKLRVPSQGRLYYLRYALKQGWSVGQIHELTGIDPWFLENLRELARFEQELIEAETLVEEVGKWESGKVRREENSPALRRTMNTEREGNPGSNEREGSMGLWPVRPEKSDEAMERRSEEGGRQESVEATERRSDEGIEPQAAARASALPTFPPSHLPTQTPPSHLPTRSPARIPPELADLLLRAKSLGYSNVQLAQVWEIGFDEVEALLAAAGVRPQYRLVDTCAAEFAAQTPYYYSTYERQEVIRCEGDNVIRSDSKSVHEAPENLFAPLSPYHLITLSRGFDELEVSAKPKVVVLGGGPNRIGQGIEFDYCCVHAAMAARELGFEAVMINSNPETVSTDYDTSDLLFFEPLTHEDVVDVCRRLSGELRVASSEQREERKSARDVAAYSTSIAENQPQNTDTPKAIKSGKDSHSSTRYSQLATRYSSPAPRHPSLATGYSQLAGVICQFGGQTPLNLARGLERAGLPILGTSPASIHLAEDREQFGRILQELGLQAPPSGIARSAAEAKAVAGQLGYPVLVRPSYVLGGRAMEVCNNEAELRYYMTHASEASGEHPILIDRFLSDATEVDVDAVCDGERTVICGVLEHIEAAGIHSGDSAMTLPPYSLSAAIVQQISYAAKRLAERIGVIGLMNVQFAIKDDDIYVLEVNPRASRTIPFIAKATGVPWAKIAAKVMLGQSLMAQGVNELPPRRHIAVKESVFPFHKFPGVDVVLGPEMRSTGEVMGVDERFSLAFAKAQMGAGGELPLSGQAFVSVSDRDKPFIAGIAKELLRHEFEIVATEGTARVLRAAGIKVESIGKIREGNAAHLTVLDLLDAGKITLIINTPERTGRHTDEGRIRAAATLRRVPIFTTLTGAKAAAAAIGALKRRTWDVVALQDL